MVFVCPWAAGVTSGPRSRPCPVTEVPRQAPCRAGHAKGLQRWWATRISPRYSRGPRATPEAFLRERMSELGFKSEIAKCKFHECSRPLISFRSRASSSVAGPDIILSLAPESVTCTGAARCATFLPSGWKNLSPRPPPPCIYAWGPHGGLGVRRADRLPLFLGHCVVGVSLSSLHLSGPHSP